MLIYNNHFYNIDKIQIIMNLTLIKTLLNVNRFSKRGVHMLWWDISFPKYTFFSADSNYEVTLMTKATVLYNGAIIWQPPAIYKSSCAIDVEYFPYDEQTCFLKMGSWTYSGFQVGKKKKVALKDSFRRLIPH